MSLINIQKLVNLRCPSVTFIQICGMKHFGPPPKYDHVQFPDRNKLKYVDKVPIFQPGIRPPRMQKKLKLMRGPEPIHNFLMHKQYGIIAIGGGRMRYGHFEMIRLTLGRKLDFDRMFAVWRVDGPWQPITKKGQGQRMGGGKGGIDHYVTPVKTGRIIVEVGGKCEFVEVKDILHDIAMKLPFKAMAVSQEMLEEMKAKEEKVEKENLNRYTMKYLMQNNMGGCQRWMSPFDFRYLGKYM